MSAVLQDAKTILAYYALSTALAKFANMDPVTAFALTCNVLQVVETSFKITRKGVAIFKNKGSLLPEYLDLEEVAKSLSITLARVETFLTSDHLHKDGIEKSPLSDKGDEELRDLCSKCKEIGEELLRRLRSYSASPERPFLDTLRVLKATWKDQDEVQAMNKRLESYQSQLQLMILQSGFTRQSTEFRNLDSQVRRTAESIWDSQAFIKRSMDTQTDVIVNKTDLSKDEILAKLEKLEKLQERLLLSDSSDQIARSRTPSPGPPVNVSLDNGRDSSGGNVTAILDAAGKGDITALREIIRDDYSSVYKYDEKTGMTALSVACKFGHVEAVDRLLRSDARVTHDDNQGKYPLHYAAEVGNGKIVRLLLFSGAGRHFPDAGGKTPADYAPPDSEAEWVLRVGSPHIEACNEKGETALHHFSRLGKIEVVKSLLDQRANVDTPDNQQQTPLFVAANGGHVDIVKLLIASGANIEHRDFRNGTPLVVAAWHGRADTVKCLLQNEADPNAQNEVRFSALNEAAKHNHLEVAKALLEFKVDTENTDVEGFRPLDRAIAFAKPQLVKLLLMNGADIKRKNSQGLTPLLAACQLGRHNCVKHLLDHGAPLDAREEQKKYSALHLAAMAGHIQIVTMLVNSQQSKDQDLVNQGNVDNWTALHEAAFYGHVDVISMLVDHGANINACGDGRCPLKLACQEGRYEAAKMLIDRGADLDHQGPLGNTQLAICAHLNHADIAKLLISKGASVDKPNCVNYSPLNQAAMRGNREVVRVLVEYGKADLEHSNRDGWTSVMEASSNGKHKVLRYLLRKGADPEAPTKKGETPLFMASRSDNLDCVKVLVEKGNVDINRPDSNGRTSIMEASDCSSLRVFKYLLDKGAQTNIEARSS